MVYDSFLINDELPLLETRLRTHWNFVDKFIIVESTHTFSGNLKPLHVQNNIAHYDAIKEKIIHIIVDEIPNTDPWKNEERQREIVLEKIPKLGYDDILTILDVDEFLKEDTIQVFKDTGFGIAIPEMSCFGYFMNWFIGYPWINGRIVRGSELYRGMNLTQIRQKEWKWNHLLNCGWHFGNIVMGDPQRLVRKLESYSHTECNTDRIKSRIVECIEQRKWFEKPENPYTILPLCDTKLPRWIEENGGWFEQNNLIRFK